MLYTFGFWALLVVDVAVQAALTWIGLDLLFFPPHPSEQAEARCGAVRGCRLSGIVVRIYDVDRVIQPADGISLFLPPLALLTCTIP